MRRAEPGLLELWRSLYDEWKKIYSAAERNVQVAGLSLPEFRALRLLAAGPSPMATFAEGLGITPAAVTGLVDRLGEKKMVRRSRSSSDRRVIMISITEGGAEALEKAMKLHVRFVEHQLSVLSADERRRLLTAFSKLARAAASFDG